MTLRTSLLCSALAVGIGLSLAPAAQAMEDGSMMKKDSMKKDTMMKKHKKHKDSMMSGDAMKKDEAAPAQ